MIKVSPEGKYDPRTATFWGRFPTEMAQPEARCQTVALYETDDSEFFAVEESRTPSGRPISATVATIVSDPENWLAERLSFLESCLP